MKAAILHYHLHPGGVTRVIEAAVNALTPLNVKTVVLAGSPASPPNILSNIAQPVPGLDYHEPTPKQASPKELADNLERQAIAALGELPDLWHIHNHSLGKNPLFTEAVRLLAQRGHKMLLQIHDFAEDLRPVQMRLLQQSAASAGQSLGAYLYPNTSHIHYATLNRRDFKLLSQAGLSEDRLHSLPNAVTAPLECHETLPDHETPQSRLILYPVRAIRRKNIGEFLLLSIKSNADEQFAVTLAPNNPAEKPVYEDWVAFAAKNKLPVQFDLASCSGRSFACLQRDASAMVTTSVAEGFGLTFLEPWLANRPVIGRNLPEITSDFSDAGVNLSGLYDKLLVPLEWIGADQFQKRVATAYSDLLAECGRQAQPDAVERAWQAACCNDRVDMGKLDESFQRIVLTKALASKVNADAIEPVPSESCTYSKNQIDLNRISITNAFGLEAYGRRLLSLYQTVAASKSSQHLDSLNAESILDAFLAPERFTLLRGAWSNQ